MNVEGAKEIFAEFKRLSREDKDLILHGLNKHFGKKISFSLDKLAEMDCKDLEIIKSTIGGLILTRDHVPDVRISYERNKDKDLPSEISFGHLNE